MLAQFVADYRPYADGVLRVGLGAVMLVAGLDQLAEPRLWAGYLAGWVANGISAVGISPTTFIMATGVLLIALGGALVMDYDTTDVAAVTALYWALAVGNLVSVKLIAGGVGYIDVLIRDIGLLVLAIGVMLCSTARPAEQ